MKVWMYQASALLSLVSVPLWLTDVVPWYFGLAPVAVCVAFWAQYLIEWYLYRKFWERR